MVKFKSKISKIGINPVVDPPERVMKIIFAAAGRSKGPIPVCGKLNGADFIQTLVRYRGPWRLYINGPMLKTSTSKVGDTVVIEIEFDAAPRSTPQPPELVTALRKDKQARKAFDALTASRQKEINRYIGSLKTAEAIDKNVKRIIAHLRGESVDHVLTRWRSAK